MNAISKRLLSWLCVIAMVLSFAPVMDLSNFAVETNAAAGDANWAASELGATGVQDKIEKAADIQTAANAIEVPETITSSGFKAVCPICKAEKTWYTIDPETGYVSYPRDSQATKYRHIVLQGDLDLTGVRYSTSSGTVQDYFYWSDRSSSTADTCILLRNANVTVDAEIRLTGDGTQRVNVMGTGTFTSTSDNSTYPGLFFLSGNKVLNLYGGTFIYNSDLAPAINMTGAGNVCNIYNNAVVGQALKNDGTLDTTNARYNVGVVGTLNMFGGTIRNGVSDNYQTGANVNVKADGVFNMYGGTIEKGYNKKTSARAGSLYVTTGATANIYGGEIKDGYSPNNGGNIGLANSATAVVNILGGKVTGGEAAANGGNIYSWGALTIGANALIEGGEAGAVGGNIYCHRFDFETSGVIRNGVAGTAGGNIGINGGQNTSVVVVSGGMIYGGKLENGTDSNIDFIMTADKTDCKLEISGGTIVGGVTFDGYDADDQFVISGAPEIVTSAQIGGETVTATTGIQLGDGDLADISGLTTDAEVTFTAGVGTTLTAVYDGVQSLVNEGCFYMTDSNTEVSVENNQLVVAEAEDPTEVIVPAKPTPVNPNDTNWDAVDQATYEKAYKGNAIDNSAAAFAKHKAKHTCPICGKNVEWEALGSEAAVTAAADTKVHYYIDDATETIKNVYGTASTDATICLWLNKDVEITGYVRGSGGLTINIFGEGTLTGTGTTSVLDVREGSTFNLYGGKFVSSTALKGTVYFYTGAADKVATVNMFDGATIGPDTPAAGAVYRNVHMRSEKVSVLNMFGGTIQNGVGTGTGTSASSTANFSVSGNLDLGDSCTFNMYGGTIKDGTFKDDAANKLGGNISAFKSSAQVNIYGGTIEGGVAKTGGNIYMGSGTTALNIYGGLIQDGEAANGGNIYTNASATSAFNLYGGTITGGEATNPGGNSYGGNIYIYNAFTMSETYANVDTVISDGKAGTGGGNIYIRDYETVINGGTITGGENTNATESGYKSGGNVFLRGGSVTMNDGIITEGVAPGTGGNVYIVGSDAATFTMNGGVVSRGENTATGATTRTANVQVDTGATFALKEGVRLDNQASAVYEDGYEAWYATNADVLAAYADNANQTNKFAYITLAGGDYTAELKNGQAIVLNLVNNKDLTLSGNGSVSLIDTENKSFKNFGEVTIADGASINFAEETFVGNDHYVTIQDGNKLSAHYVEMKLTHITLRTTANGLYYKVQIKCDDTLAGRVKTFGVVVDTDAQPTNLVDFQNYSISSVFVPVDNTVSATSLDVFNILGDRDAATNYEFLKTKVYANLYMKVNVTGDDADGYAVMGLKAGTTVGKSLLEVVQGIDAAWATIAATDAAKAKMKEFVQNWAEAAKLTADGVAEWNDATSNIVAS